MPLQMTQSNFICVPLVWHPIRACFRYLTQKPWNRFPIKTKTVVVNEIICCIAGGRNKIMAAIAYDQYNAELIGTGLGVRTPQTISNVTHCKIPFYIKSMGGRGVLKVSTSVENITFGGSLSYCKIPLLRCHTVMLAKVSTQLQTKLS